MSMGLLFVLFKYFEEFPKLMNGTVDKGLFKLDFTIGYGIHLEIFNFALIAFVLVFLFNLGVLIYASTGQKIDDKITGNIR